MPYFCCRRDGQLLEPPKLTPQLIDPFPVSKVINSVRLRLAGTMRVHPMFHINKVKPVKEALGLSSNQESWTWHLLETFHPIKALGMPAMIVSWGCQILGYQESDLFWGGTYWFCFSISYISVFHLVLASLMFYFVMCVCLPMSSQVSHRLWLPTPVSCYLPLPLCI